MSAEFFPNITVNLNAPYSEVHVEAKPDETIDQFLSRIDAEYGDRDISSVVLVAFKGKRVPRTADVETTLQDANSSMWHAIQGAASKFSDQDAAITKALEVLANMQFKQSAGFEDDDGLSRAWTNSDYRRACTALIVRLQDTVANTPPTRF